MGVHRTATNQFKSLAGLGLEPRGLDIRWSRKQPAFELDRIGSPIVDNTTYVAVTDKNHEIAGWLRNKRRQLRALGHPVEIGFVDAVALTKRFSLPLFASQLVGQSPSLSSWHSFANVR